MKPGQSRIICILAMISMSLLLENVFSQMWSTNMAFLDLQKAILNQNQIKASHFVAWSVIPRQCICTHEREAAQYGLLVYYIWSKERSKELLHSWITLTGNLSEHTVRQNLLLHIISNKLGPDELWILLETQDPIMMKRILFSAVEKQPEQIEEFVQILISRGLIHELSSNEQVQLAAAYSHLANDKRMLGASNEEVLALAERALALNPKDERGLIVKALILNAQGKGGDGLRLLEQAVTYHPKSNYPWSFLADLRLKLNDYQGAEMASRKAIKLEPTDYWSYSLLASALLKQDRCIEALPFAQFPAEKFPNQPHYKLILNDIYWCLDY